MPSEEEAVLWRRANVFIHPEKDEVIKWLLSQRGGAKRAPNHSTPPAGGQDPLAKRPLGNGHIAGGGCRVASEEATPGGEKPLGNAEGVWPGGSPVQGQGWSPVWGSGPEGARFGGPARREPSSGTRVEPGAGAGVEPSLGVRPGA